ncbi:phosphatase PAP2 family protein [Actinoplanes friuliensis]|uniref:Phosphoesterase pa-phosphatase-like protein n=1 Tax=Actinoplanes friuliensis DSM 7358 TaxID=1246995 RepID=U5W6K8_9ACTN|nr:phosphatase PAP2 family protein [Actinoplanes friuliensis]AGZ44789.1 phosphoesterase pa-phosphatase-like protein [Actinoplanes friuliensis DSM 7358]
MSTDDGRVHRKVGWAPVRHFTERSLLGLLVVVAVGLGFGLLLLLVRFRWSPLQGLDRSVADGLNGLVAPHEPLVKVLESISQLGGRPVMIWLVAVAVVLLLIRRRTRLAVYLVITGVGALLLDPSLKTLVGRLRPVVDVPVATAPGNSFPSGHALGSMVVYGGLLLVFLPAIAPKWRKPAIGLIAVIIAAVGFTRISLGVHFLSDVLAGWLLGAAWLGVTAYAFRVWRREVGRPVGPIQEGLEPEAAHDVTPAPDEEKVLPHPWTGAAELIVGWVLTFGVLYVIGWAVTNHTNGTWFGNADVGVNRWLQTFRTPALDDLSYGWSKAGDTHMILLVSLVFCPLVLALWRRWRPVLFVVLAMFGELSLFLSTAAAVGRPRPPVDQLDGQMPTSSFPSGHIAATMCLYVSIAVLTVPRVRAWWRWVFVALAVIMPAGVALSRMYRGMHHPTDVFGAGVLTACWITLLWFVLKPNADVEQGNRADAGELTENDADRDLTEAPVS